ncbi:MAG: hypothetical protein QME73_03050 [Bacillota bacterium]|nr:hypothetical protein [Bacillota bacterium]
MENAGTWIAVVVFITLIVLFIHNLKKKVDEGINSMEEMDLKYKNKTLK